MVNPSLKSSAQSHPDNSLPKTYTCFFNLELPNYSSQAILKQKFLIAINMCEGLDGDDDNQDVVDNYEGRESSEEENYDEIE